MNTDNYKVLIVEDSSSTADHISEILEGINIRTAFATNGETAIKKAKANRFDLILLDIILPDIDGYTVCKRLKAFSETKDIPVIFITTKADSASLVKGFEHGSVDYVKKPFVVNELLARVKTHLDMNRQREELLKAKEDAEKADKQKSVFVANMSHEIRSPLNSILGFSDLLKNEVLSKDERDTFLNTIYNSGTQLLKLVDDIIHISKIEAGQLRINKTECNIHKLLSGLHLEYTQKKNKKGLTEIELKFKNQADNKDLVILADPVRLREVLSNMLDNALKFIDSGLIEFGYSINDRQDNMLVEFFVKDTGIGISRDKLHVVFERFGQVSDSLSRNIEGTGLGLAISKHLVELMGGEIHVESEAGKGTKFTFSIPYIAIETKGIKEKSRKPVDAGYNWADKKILIAEDSESGYLLLKAMLKGTKAKIIHAISGIEAVELCSKEKNIDLVLMDIKLPGIDGLEATVKIKEFNKNLPVIAQTACALPDDKKNFLEGGCDDYIEKPIRVKVLLEKMSKYLDNS